MIYNQNANVWWELFWICQDYEPTGATPVRCETDVPSKGTIEALCTMPMDALLEEFRENNPYESVDAKDLKPSLIPRSPLVERNWEFWQYGMVHLIYKNIYICVTYVYAVIVIVRSIVKYTSSF